jgi:hypothetical protein
MWYTITILSVICCTYLPVTPLRAANDAVKGHSIECETGFILPDVPHRSCLLAQAGKATAPEKKESGLTRRIESPKRESSLENRLSNKIRNLRLKTLCPLKRLMLIRR